MGSKAEEYSSPEPEPGQYSRYDGFIDWRKSFALASELGRSSMRL
jgi:hypothetical protein